MRFAGKFCAIPLERSDRSLTTISIGVGGTQPRSRLSAGKWRSRWPAKTRANSACVLVWWTRKFAVWRVNQSPPGATATARVASKQRERENNNKNGVRLSIVRNKMYHGRRILGPE